MPVVTLVFDPMTNDPNRVAQRYVSKGIAKGRTADDVVQEAWQNRHVSVPSAITTSSWTGTAPLVPDVSYDSAIVGGASKAEVMGALIKAGKR
jgi:hypothetical protein